MKSITIHGLDQPLWSILKSRAESEGISMNKTIKQLLERAVGITPSEVNDKKEQFREFSGVWSKNDLSEFIASTRVFEEVNPEDWR